MEKLLKKEGHMPEDKYLLMSGRENVWCRVYEHITRRRRIRFAEVQNQMSRHRCRLRKLGRVLDTNFPNGDAPPQKARLSAGLVLGLTP